MEMSERTYHKIIKQWRGMEPGTVVKNLPEATARTAMGQRFIVAAKAEDYDMFMSRQADANRVRRAEAPAAPRESVGPGQARRGRKRRVKAEADNPPAEV